MVSSEASERAAAASRASSGKVGRTITATEPPVGRRAAGAAAAAGAVAPERRVVRHHATSSTSASTATTHAHRRSDRRRLRPETAGRPPEMALSSSARTRKLPLFGRRSGSFSRHCMMSATSSRGTSYRRRSIGVGVSRACAASTAAAERPPNGGVPTSIS